MLGFILLFDVVLSHGFLLQTNSPLNSGTHTAGNQQYTTKEELYDVQNQLQKEVNFVRNDMDRKFDLLTSQLQQMFASFQQQITTQKFHNDAEAAQGFELKYNEVMGNYTKLQDKFDSLQIRYSKQEIDLELVKNKTRILEDEIRTNASLLNVMTRISESENHQNSKIDKLEKSVNVSFWDIRQQIAKNSEKVTLTACVDKSESGLKQSGYIIKYGDLRSEINVNNLSSFRSSGKFTCEKEGLYLVSAWDASNVAGSEFSIYKNGNLIANAYIASSVAQWYTATAVVAVDLLPNDTVWIQVSGQMYVVYDQQSCLTIVKVQ